MGEPRILHIELDERSIVKRNADIEREREIALLDLMEANHFDVAGVEGPYRLRLGIEENRLAMDIRSETDEPLTAIRFGLARFRRAVRDYFTICDSYFKAAHQDGARGLEAIDMARRAIHNEGAELLCSCLEGRVEMDQDTARRLFTLICVLHIRPSRMAIDSPSPAISSGGG